MSDLTPQQEAQRKAARLEKALKIASFLRVIRGQLQAQEPKKQQDPLTREAWAARFLDIVRKMPQTGNPMSRNAIARLAGAWEPSDTTWDLVVKHLEMEEKIRREFFSDQT